MEIAFDTAAVRKRAIRNGLIWTAVDILLFLIVYYSKPELMGSFSWSGIRMVIGLALAVYFCIDLRKVAGYWNFREALSNIFLMFIISAVIVYFFTILFGKYIEPGYAEKMKGYVIENTTGMMEKFKVDQETIDQAVEDAEESFEKQFNPGFKEIAMSLGTSVIIYFIGALIFAAIFKRERPLFQQAEEQ